MTIKAWHYCRLTQYEREEILTSELRLPTSDFLAQRYARAVEKGLLMAPEAELLKQNLSPQRLNKPIRAVLKPVSENDLSVRDLLSYWGGEITRDASVSVPGLQEKLRSIGDATVFELEVPENCISNGCRERLEAGEQGFDLRIMRPLLAHFIIGTQVL